MHSTLNTNIDKKKTSCNSTEPWLLHKLHNYRALKNLIYKMNKINEYYESTHNR